jgi:CHAD domain-containing protein
MSITSQNGRHATTNRHKPSVTTTLLTRRRRELERHLFSAVEGVDTHVHQARVASRRLREGLPVLAAGLKRGKKAQRKVRRVTRALGTVREMDVTMQILDELARQPKIPRDALEDVRGHVLAERERSRAIMLTRLRELNTSKLMRRLEEVAIESTMSEATVWRDALATRVGRRAKRFAAAIHAAGQIYAPDRLHDVRIATKKLRYVLELALDIGIRPARSLVAFLKRLQETLGRLNDLNVLQRHVAAVQTKPPSRQGATRRGLDAIARTLEEECRHLHARYTKEVAALLELAESCRSTIVPLIATSGRRRPLLKMSRANLPRPAAARRA